MARSQKSPLSGGRRYVVNQGGAPDPETTDETIVIGHQADEKTDKAAAKTPAKS